VLPASRIQFINVINGYGVTAQVVGGLQIVIAKINGEQIIGTVNLDTMPGVIRPEPAFSSQIQAGSVSVLAA
jgi:hypothetical protein